MASAGRKIGIGAISVGVALAGIGAFAGGASAGVEGASGTDASCETSFNVMWGLDNDPNHISVDDVVGGGTTVVSDGDLTVTLSNALPITGQNLTELTIRSLDFSTNKPVDSVEVRLWQASGKYNFEQVDYDPPVTSGTVVSEPGSHPSFPEAPVKGLEFCYEAESEVIPTSTEAPTTTTEAEVLPTNEIATTTTTAAPDIAPQEVEVEVLPQVETAPQAEIAFTGSETGPLVAVGGGLVFAGLALVGIDRVGLVRKGRHSR